MTRNDFKENISQALDEMKKEQGSSFDLSKVNLAELERRTGISRSKLRRLKRNDFVLRSMGTQVTNLILPFFQGLKSTLMNC